VKVLVYDIETDNLLMDCTTVYCMVTKDIHTGEVTRFTPDNMHEAWDHLCSADRLIGHNSRMFDDPAVTKLIGGSGELPHSIDTLVMSSMLYPSLVVHPAKGHSLEKWGTYLGCHKLEFKDFSKYTPEMLTYCEQDVEVTEKLYRFLAPKVKPYSEALKLEHEVSSILVSMVQNGAGFNVQKAMELSETLAAKLYELKQTLRTMIRPWYKLSWYKKPAYYYHPVTHEAYKKKGDCRPKLRKELVDGPQQYKLEVTEFNINSDAHIIRHLTERRGWKPKKKTQSGQWCVDEKVISSIADKYEEAKVIAECKLIDKRLTMVKSWIEKARNGRIHGDIRSIGTAPHRMSHSNPNLGQVPKAKKGAPYGQECRECFGPREGWVQVGCDASGLQARMLGHWIGTYDGGAYADIIMSGDIHTYHQEVVSQKVLVETRDQSKTLLYAYLFGAGDPKLGSSVNGGKAEGALIREQLESGIHGLGELQNALKAEVAKSAGIITLDGRRIPCDVDRLALNYLLMSSEAIIMKRALVIFDKWAKRSFGPHGEHWAYMLNVHDESQWECESGIAKPLGELFRLALIAAGRYYKLNIELDGDPKVGSNWHECH
jgi:DNA polymerase-1